MVVLEDDSAGSGGVGSARRRPRAAVTIDLTGDSPQAPPRPAQRPRRVIDLTADEEEEEDDDEVVIIGPPPRMMRFPPAGAFAPPPPPPPPPLPGSTHALILARDVLRRRVREPAFFSSSFQNPQRQIEELEHLRRTVAMPRAPPPPPPARVVRRTRKVKMARVERKPLQSSPCPVCFEDFAGQRVRSAFCKYGCGGNVHAACMDAWKNKRSRDHSRGPLTCVLCRAPWNGMREEPV